jgi:putative glutamine amidotransferase
VKPKIAVTGPRHGGKLLTWLNCFAIWRAGGTPIAIRPGNESQLADMDGFLIGGGEDIDAVLYDDELRFKAVPDGERDRLELEALAVADKKSLPVFGICRGAQLMNIFRGGTLNQDSYVQHGGPKRHRSIWPRKMVKVYEWSCLFDLIGEGDCVRVNSLHHQSVERLGDGLEVCARDTLGITQGIEHRGDHFYVGVQWHPEILFWREDQVNVFRGLVDAAA